MNLKAEFNVWTILVLICIILDAFLSLFTLCIILRISKSYLMHLTRYQATADAPNLRPVEFLDIY